MREKQMRLMYMVSYTWSLLLFAHSQQRIKSGGKQMDLISILLIAFGLSMDAFAVSVTNGITIRNVRGTHALRIGLYFGGFQALMPVIGWAVGYQFRDYITSIDHWIAFGLLAFIGIKMIKEAMEQDDICEVPEGNGFREAAVSKQEAEEECVLKTGRLLVLAVATSIDALAVGVSFAFLSVSIWGASAVIGLITFGICVTGVFIGKRFGCLLKKKAEIMGGVILVLIGAKILAEHMNLLEKIF